MTKQHDPPTFGDLFSHLNDRIQEKQSSEPFHLVHRFANKHGIDAAALIPVLEGFGGYDDMEVVLNVVGRIPDELPIGSDVVTAEKFAVREGFYCRWLDGQWKECAASDPDATPDLNKAMWKLLKQGNNCFPATEGRKSDVLR